MSSTTEYWLYGEVPVRMERTATGGLRVLAFDSRTLEHRLDPWYRSAIFHDRDNMARRLTGEEYWAEVDRLTAEAKRPPPPPPPVAYLIRHRMTGAYACKMGYAYGPGTFESKQPMVYWSERYARQALKARGLREDEHEVVAFDLAEQGGRA